MNRRWHCMNCVYYDKPLEGVTGQCRRYAPLTPRADGGTYRWPPVHAADWCGDIKVDTCRLTAPPAEDG